MKVAAVNPDSRHTGLRRCALVVVLSNKERDQLPSSLTRVQTARIWLHSAMATATIVFKNVYREHLSKLYDAFIDLDTELQDDRLFLMSAEVSIADAFWSMKMLKLLEVGYPIKRYHPNIYAWFQRVYERPSFQNEVMSNNRWMNRFFRAKSSVEKLLGFGVGKTLKELAHE